MTRILAIGEAMVELTHQGPTALSLSYAGDTANTAVYLRRLLGSTGSVDYATAVGDDPYSEGLVERLAEEGLGTRLVWRRIGRRLGLYLVRTDDTGERHFVYYRAGSAATGLFGPGHDPGADAAIASYDMVYLSLITLQILTPVARARLWDVLDNVRAHGGRVVFDGNYRPTGWPNARQARIASEAALRRTDVALPTWSDEQALFGEHSPDDCIDRLRALGVAEGVVKNGPAPCVAFTATDAYHVAPTLVARVVDTTAAGDAFNAAFLAARLQGASLVEAARAGHRLAGSVIQHPGAIVPTALLPPAVPATRHIDSGPSYPRTIHG
ncbi:sugar kinase [Salinispora arenicola]|uniref:2-dehydro-3-deoxygluconokinase n=1 Tax=Salinispora arenicola TaxID=168697 RepID=A0A542XQU4_SALAC|nr:sugar kinase [Salinispora arenicola]MCN0153258.1 sugar kinase [Salinispora arenicola]TQL38207.1 2-dehydro-3-deoxygluconokinase [Salinispora arenicola]GIM87814.1 2-dehydro-3-deoxygluconokinase [Salinispora arenicola]